MSNIQVTYMRSWEDTPLAVLDGGPFIDCARSPEQLREMAGMLLKVADAAEAIPTTGRYWKHRRVVLTPTGDEVAA